MLKYLKENKFIVACFVLFALLYKFGNNMEFYQSSKTCSSPKNINRPSNEFKLSPTDDIVLERKDMVQLKNEKIGRFKYNGYDGFPTVLKGWWGSSSPVADNLYISSDRLIWPD